MTLVWLGLGAVTLAVAGSMWWRRRREARDMQLLVEACGDTLRSLLDPEQIRSTPEGAFVCTRGGATLRIPMRRLVEALLTGQSDDERMLRTVVLLADAIQEQEPGSRKRLEEALAAVLDELAPGARRIASSDLAITYAIPEHGQRSFIVAALLLDVWGQSTTRRRATLEKLVRLRLRDEDEAPVPSLGPERLFPRFVTAARESKVGALLAAARERGDIPSDAEVVMPTPFRRQVPGLPVEIDYVVDLGATVMPLSADFPQAEELGLDGVHAQALEALRTNGSLALPGADDVTVHQDRDDHGAAALLLVPELLEEDEHVYAVAPTHDTLILFGEDAADRARAAMDRETRDLDDAPLLTPVRVTANGFEALAWEKDGAATKVVAAQLN